MTTWLADLGWLDAETEAIFEASKPHVIARKEFNGVVLELQGDAPKVETARTRAPRTREPRKLVFVPWVAPSDLSLATIAWLRRKHEEAWDKWEVEGKKARGK